MRPAKWLKRSWADQPGAIVSFGPWSSSICRDLFYRNNLKRQPRTGLRSRSCQGRPGAARDTLSLSCRPLDTWRDSESDSERQMERRRFRVLHADIKILSYVEDLFRRHFFIIRGEKRPCYIQSLLILAFQKHYKNKKIMWSPSLFTIIARTI